MTRQQRPEDPRYTSLASPLKNAGPITEAHQETLLREESEILGGTIFKRIGHAPPRRGMQIIKAGDLTIIAGKTTPVLSSNRSADFSCFMAMPYSGGFTTKDGSLCDEVSPGDIYFNQNYYGTSTIGYLSSLFFALDRKRLDRAMRTISGSESTTSLDTSLIIKSSGNKREATGSSKLWSLIKLIDQLYGESPYIPSCLGLDEQFYRLLALSLIETAGRIEKVQKRWEATRNIWQRPLDNLVDYIRANSHLNLTITDLEEQSHYSARHLQNLFRETFNCTPMQFIRRQRLQAAMEQLQIADWNESVTRVARNCGYRYSSNFTTDFQKEFGVSPSVVLRSARGRGKTPRGA